MISSLINLSWKLVGNVYMKWFVSNDFCTMEKRSFIVFFKNLPFYLLRIVLDVEMDRNVCNILIRMISSTIPFKTFRNNK